MRIPTALKNWFFCIPTRPPRNFSEAPETFAQTKDGLSSSALKDYLAAVAHHVHDASYSIQLRPDGPIIHVVNVAAQRRHQRRVQHLMLKRKRLLHTLKSLNPGALRRLNQYLLELSALSVDSTPPRGQGSRDGANSGADKGNTSPVHLVVPWESPVSVELRNSHFDRVGSRL